MPKKNNVSVTERLENNFAAKIRWRMRYDRSPELITVADKILLKKYAASRNVETCPTILVATDISEISFESLPDSCMIKASHGSGWNIMRKDGCYFYFGNGSDFDSKILKNESMSVREVETMCNNWLNLKYSSNEWVYHQMTPAIIIEEILEPFMGKELLDFRFYTFDGEVAAINVGSPSYRTDDANAFFSRDWQLMELSEHAEALPDPLPPRPPNLEEMLEACKRLGKNIDFVRIDFYETINGPVLGEMTVYPEGGKPFSPSGCRGFNRWLGRRWKMTGVQELFVFMNNVRDVTASICRKLGL